MNGLDSINVSEITQVMTIFEPKTKKISERSAYALSFCISGRIVYEHNGKEFVSTPDCAVFIPKGKTYKLYNHDGNGEFPLINFLCSGVFTDEFICIPIHSADEYMEDYNRLLDITLNRPSRLKCLSIFYRILDRLNNEGSENGGRLEKVMEYIRSNFADCTMNSRKLAEKGKISEVYLRRLFAKEYNTSPKQYIIEMRIEYAKRLLIQSNASIEETAVNSGFSNVYSFCRTFKTHTGTTPERYRNEKRNAGI